MTKVVDAGDGRQGQEIFFQKSMILYVPRAERPMVPVHRVGELARFGTSQCVAHVAVRVESESISRRAVVEKPFVRNQPSKRSKGRGEGEMEVRDLRVWIFIFVVMDLVAVEDEPRVLRYVHPVVHKVLGREMRRSQPERRVSALDLKGREDREKREAKSPRFELGLGLLGCDNAPP